MSTISKKCKNAAEILGADFKEALFFGEACCVLQNQINKKVKAHARKTILGTTLLGHKFESWLEDMHKVESNNPLLPDQKLMGKTEENFAFGIVESVLSTLLTKQFYEKLAA